MRDGSWKGNKVNNGSRLKGNIRLPIHHARENYGAEKGGTAADMARLRREPRYGTMKDAVDISDGY